MLDLENVTIRFDEKEIVTDFSLKVRKDQFIGVVGKNGSGKSSLAYYVAGVIPEHIPAIVTGKKMTRERPGLILQNPSSQFLSLSVKEELSGTEYSNFEIDHLIGKSVYELSEGEKQKINLIANLGRSDFLILDEPLELLDPLSANTFMKFIKGSKKKTILWFDKNEKYLSGADEVITLSTLRNKKILKKKRILGTRVIVASFNYKKEDFSLDSIEFSAKKGEIVSIIGNNGSGKSTLLRIIGGITKAEGTIKTKKISYSIQNPVHSLFSETVEKELMLSTNKMVEIQRVCEVLGIIPLLKNDPSQLSKGQQKLVSIASSFLGSGEILLLDEPTTWLDEDNKHRFFQLVNETKKTVILSTHDQDVVNFSDRNYIIENGRLSECSSTKADQFFL
ncbi:MAG: ATP-binding cassette domain-containing protein [Nanoarchaeota archaeon]|nr:ATP-binding cassette domain-containing protein [Nanoarchaeota archaeon]